MECLKAEFFSPIALFKTPFSIKGIETYPLPPYSTVIGLLYTASGKKWKGERFNISVQGDYEAIFRDYVRFRKYNKKDKKLETLPLEVPLFYNFRLTVHILGDENLLKEFEKALKFPYVFPYLSGGEYPVKITKVKMVACRKEYFDTFNIPKNAYIPENIFTEEFRVSLEGHGVYYRVPSFLISQKPRQHEWVGVYYVQKGTKVSEMELLVDEEGEPVWV
ncbi:type I-B CRISPR-associated protein Cas5b [Aquifex aeolicus]|uniref:CRISPR-associated protein Cas5 n=1 Tax=Aquifex aeolicus (strain VF5) TaxID=224324 RepID=O66696_AQUAE|nr:type I-B CRISPR-associated protein Cas5b [Aquifex aeolicus]AAC06653.1 putative protein [Aquifex aeolicus VF5]